MLANDSRINANRITPRRIFLQYLNPEILNLYGATASKSRDEIYSLVLKTTRYAFLLADDGLVFPASYFFEVKFMDRFLNHLKPLETSGLLHVASATPDLHIYAEKKRREYREELTMFPEYVSEDPADEMRDRRLIWLPRIRRSSSTDIAASWQQGFGDGGIWRSVLERLAGHYNPLAKWERAIAETPARLEDRAFIARYAKALLPFELEIFEHTQMAMMISRAYLESYLEELGAMVIVDTPLGKLDCGLPQWKFDGALSRFSYRELEVFFSNLGIRKLVESTLGWRQLIDISNQPILRWAVKMVVLNYLQPSRPLDDAMVRSRFRMPPAVERLAGTQATDEILRRLWELYGKVSPLLSESGAETQEGEIPPPLYHSGGGRRRSLLVPDRGLLLNLTAEHNVNRNDVFLVHGRDTAARDSVKALLRAASINPIEWEEAVAWTQKMSPSTLEVVKTGLERVQAIIILFTPDETVQLRKEFLNARDPESERSAGFQPRPNVLVEAGMAFALNPDRTLILQIGSTRPISDLAGLNYLSFDGSGGSRHALAARLQVAGCEPRVGTDFYNVPFAWLGK